MAHHDDAASPHYRPPSPAPFAGLAGSQCAATPEVWDGRQQPGARCAPRAPPRSAQPGARWGPPRTAQPGACGGPRQPGRRRVLSLAPAGTCCPATPPSCHRPMRIYGRPLARKRCPLGSSTPPQQSTEARPAGQRETWDHGDKTLIAFPASCPPPVPRSCQRPPPQAVTTAASRRPRAWRTRG